MYNRANKSQRRIKRLAHLAALVAIGLSLSLLPSRIVAPLKHVQQALLRPVQQWLAGLWHSPGLASSDDRIAELELLRRENAELRTALSLVRMNASSAGDPTDHESTDSEPLLIAGLVEVRVLGRQARGFLEANDLLDAGTDDGVRPESLVVDHPAQLIDQGTEEGVRPGQFVLAGRQVLGKIRDAGARTATMQRPCASTYRDLVQLGIEQEGRVKLGPRGILEGTGQELCRIRLVPITEAVSEGDLVLTTGGEGLLPTPLVYGRVTRAERTAGAAHWDLWMQPIESNDASRVAVLRAELNPLRVADATTSDEGIRR
jgi:cell shape-determining protein MreC